MRDRDKVRKPSKTLHRQMFIAGVALTHVRLLRPVRATATRAVLAMFVVMLSACRGADVIPFRATRHLHTCGAEVGDGTIVITLINQSEYHLTGLTVEVSYHLDGSSRYRIMTFEVPVTMPPNGGIKLRLPLVRQRYEIWDYQPNVYRPGPSVKNSDFCMLTTHPDWSVAIPVVRGHRSNAIWGENYYHSIFGNADHLMDSNIDELCARSESFAVVDSFRTP